MSDGIHLESPNERRNELELCLALLEQRVALRCHDVSLRRSVDVYRSFGCPRAPRLVHSVPTLSHLHDSFPPLVLRINSGKRPDLCEWSSASAKREQPRNIINPFLTSLFLFSFSENNMPHSFGYRAHTRTLFKKPHGTNGRVHTATFLKQYKVCSLFVHCKW